jgi:histidinol phosphatase-like enzyme
MLHYLMDALRAAPARSVMIGDTTHDLLMAANAGIRSIAMTHGAHGVDAPGGSRNVRRRPVDLRTAPVPCALSMSGHWGRRALR